MVRLSVLQTSDERLDAILTGMLSKICCPMAGGVVIAPWRGDVSDILLVSPRARTECLRSSVLVVPGDLRARISADSVITYGYGSRDTVTASSVGDGRCVLAIQRDIITVWGGAVEQQEMPIAHGDACAEELMAAVAALAALGIAPETFM